MPKRNDIHSILVIGSGPIVIGQAAEFDYSGTQACKALREEGYKVILVNSNPATIMTDLDIADVVYIEPLDADVITQVIKKERPDGVLGTMGGQTSLNLLKELHSRGVFDEFDVEIVGTSIHAVETAEDRDMFKLSMELAGEPVPKSRAVHSCDEAKRFCTQIGYPVVIRPAYTLGGTGSGIAKDEKELELIVNHGILQSPIRQVLIEEALLGIEEWGEFEFEVLRDKNDTCIIVCPMENLDPMGIHTGESIVVAPTQTLNDADFQMLRSAAIRIIRHIKIQGACNIQFAFNHRSGEYKVIEVNPRVSRSSALASKATGYPIAKIAAKIACGLTLDEIRNDVTKETFSCFEPSIDYCVVKIPRWPFDKFRDADRRIGTQMKSTGETMAIGRTFEEALQKAVRGLEIQRDGLCKDGKNVQKMSNDDLIALLSNPTDARLFHIIEAFDAGFDVERIHAITGIHSWFLQKIEHIHEKSSTVRLERNSVCEAKQLGFSDRQIANITGTTEKRVREFRRNNHIIPTFKMVDTCAAEFSAKTPYLYSTYEEEDECIPQKTKKVLIIGSGPIRIGQGIEFDYGCVHSVFALKEENIQAMIINNNPETVSTDFDTSDKLFFEPITFEDIMNIIDAEHPNGVILQFGGQTAINLAIPLHDAGIPILGTSPYSIDIAEDREKFAQVLAALGIPYPPYKTATSPEEAQHAAHDIGYPVLLRPSYVLGGRAMEVVRTDEDLLTYLEEAVEASPNHPIFLDKFIESAIELEVDALCDGTDVFIAAIMEHIEEAGIHSGDSICSIPPYSVSNRIKEKIIDFTTKISRHLGVVGLINIQYAAKGEEVFVIEANPRASRTVPFVSKTVGIPLAKIATKLMLGKKLRDFGLTGYIEPSFYSIKVPVFPFAKLSGMDVSFSPEMKSTGEIMASDASFNAAFSKALLAAGMRFRNHGCILLCVPDANESEEIAHVFTTKGFSVVKAGDGLSMDTLLAMIQSRGIDAVFFSGKADSIVRIASKSGIPLISSRRSAELLAEVNSFPAAAAICRLGEFGCSN